MSGLMPEPVKQRWKRRILAISLETAA